MTIQRTYLIKIEPNFSKREELEKTYKNTPIAKYCNSSMPKPLKEGKRSSYFRSVFAEPTKSILKNPSENSQSCKNQEVSFSTKVTARIFKKGLDPDSLEPNLKIKQLKREYKKVKPTYKNEFSGHLPWEIADYLREKMSKIKKDYSSLFTLQGCCKSISRRESSIKRKN